VNRGNRRGILEEGGCLKSGEGERGTRRLAKKQEADTKGKTR